MIDRASTLGWVKDKADGRDKVFAATIAHVTGAAPIPDHMDLRALMPPVRDQLELGCCTGFGVAAVLDALHCKKPRWAGPSSPLFIYYAERDLEGTINDDAGAQIRDGIKQANKVGACLETLWKYDTKKFTKKPSATAFKDASKRTISVYERVLGKTAMLNALSMNKPFVFGFVCYDGLMSEETAKNGVLPMPGANEQSIGGHCVVCVGYDKPTDRFLIRNSWSTAWGLDGHFWMPAAYITNTQLADDMWVVSA